VLKVVFMRHGQSWWNLENRFTGWIDVDLSLRGLEEARQAGRVLKHHGYQFDLAFTSLLKRAIGTLINVQYEMDLLWLPVEKDWRLNERHYGALQGLNKAEVAQHYGEEQVHLWRRGFAVRPPLMKETDPNHPRFDPRYRHLTAEDGYRFEGAESLKETMNRAVACWEQSIVPRMREGRRLLISAHGNTLRALVKHLDRISDEEIMRLDIPTGVPLVYEFDDDLKVLASYYLSDPAEFTLSVEKQLAQMAV
jgi:2,3-bisphosphoglycerate-dependent phosphoglycerate mutase